MAIQSEPHPVVGRAVWTIDWPCQVSPKQDNREWPTMVEKVTRSPTGYWDHTWQLAIKLRRRWRAVPLLTPNALLFLNSNLVPELQPHHTETAELRKRAKHLLKCKKAVWSRWTKEYLRTLRERHRAQRGAGRDTPAAGDMVIIKTEEKNRGKWPLRIIKNLIFGNDSLRGAKVCTGKSYVEHAIQQLYPLELSCDKQMPASQAGMSLEVAPFCPRRDTAIAARLQLQRKSEMNSAISLHLADELTL